MKTPVLNSLTLGLLATLALTGAARAQEKTVRIGTEAAYAPFEYKDDKGELKGYEIQLGNALCAAAKMKCEWVNADFDSLIPALNAHKIDAILSQMSITDDRKKAVDFTNQVTIAPARLVAKDGSGITDDPATLKGKTIAVQSGTTHEKYVTEKLAGIAVPRSTRPRTRPSSTSRTAAPTPPWPTPPSNTTGCRRPERPRASPMRASP